MLKMTYCFFIQLHLHVLMLVDLSTTTIATIIIIIIIGISTKEISQLVACVQRPSGGVAVGAPPQFPGVVHPQQQYYPSQPLYVQDVPLQEVPNGHETSPAGKKWFHFTRSSGVLVSFYLHNKTTQFYKFSSLSDSSREHLSLHLQAR